MVVVTAGAAGLRFAGLGQRPMHPDEANQAVKAGILLETGRYEYSPDEHHGPSLYWLTVPVLRLLGAHDLAHTSEGEYRLVPALFGVALVALVFLVSDGLGRGPTVLAAAFTALSPAMVFYGRYYIQETLLVFFTFAAIACGWRYLRSRSAGWAIAAGGFVGLMHATKETWVLAAAAMVVAVAACTGSTWLAARGRENRSRVVANALGYLRRWPIYAGVAAACLAAVLLYACSGEKWWSGPLDSILAYRTYFRRGSESGIHAASLVLLPATTRLQPPWARIFLDRGFDRGPGRPRHDRFGPFSVVRRSPS